MLVGFGGPECAGQIRPFLDNVLRGRPIARERYEEVVRHYEAIGGRSPYNELTMRQAGALRAELRRIGIDAPVAVGMRNWTPYIEDALRELAARGARRALGFVLAAHRCEASWERYLAAVDDARRSLGAAAPECEYPEPWHAHPLFIRAVTERTRDGLGRLDGVERARAHFIFTAHSIPVAMAAASGYADQITDSARAVARELGVGGWTLAFQSRSGSPREPWLEPDVGDALRKVGGRTAVVVPIGFLCDHVEVLYDLDVEAARIARDARVTMVRAPTVGDHPAFIQMLAEIARAHLGG
jgi:ferrochelatase